MFWACWFAGPQSCLPAEPVRVWVTEMKMRDPGWEPLRCGRTHSRREPVRAGLWDLSPQPAHILTRVTARVTCHFPSFSAPAAQSAWTPRRAVPGEARGPPPFVHSLLSYMVFPTAHPENLSYPRASHAVTGNEVLVLKKQAKPSMLEHRDLPVAPWRRGTHLVPDSQRFLGRCP